MGSASDSIFERLETAIAEWSVEIKSSSAGMAEKLARAKDRLGDTPEGAESLEALTASLDFARSEFARLEVALRECLGSAKSANDRAGEASDAAASLREELTALRQQIDERIREELTALRQQIDERIREESKEFRQQLDEQVQAVTSAAGEAPARDEVLIAEVESLQGQMRELRELAEHTAEPETEESLAAVCEEVERLRSAVAGLGESAPKDPGENLSALQSEIGALKDEIAQVQDALQRASVSEESAAAPDPGVSELRAELFELRHALGATEDTARRVEELEGLLAVERERADRLEQQVSEAGQPAEFSGLPQEVSAELDMLREELADLRAAWAESRVVPVEDARPPEVPAYEPPPPPPPPPVAQHAAVVNLDLSGFDHDGRRRRMGDILVDAGVLTQDQLEQALQEQQEHPQRRLGAILVDLGLTESDAIAQVLACQLKLPYVHLEQEVPEESAVRLVNSRLARHHRCIPVRLEDETVILAMANPLDLIAIEDIELATSRRVDPVVAAEPDIAKAIEWFYGSET